MFVDIDTTSDDEFVDKFIIHLDKETGENVFTDEVLSVIAQTPDNYVVKLNDALEPT